ncbi:MAG: 4-hydroxy-tetrahydrodipicolinate reductase [candidate division WOR-3 bacterium]|nr:4-hydroxy-tetrahydrodipicolinate reductase [candidate division WOR-3 bacterium]
MGCEIKRLLSQQSDIEVVGGVEAPGHPQIGAPLGSGTIVTELSACLTSVDVVVDFSNPVTVVKNVNLCAEGGTSFITGVTGFSAEQLRTIRDAGRKIPVVWAPNFARGIAVLSRIAMQAAQLLGDEYDIHLIEIHHKKKKDAPSGTARQLTEELQVVTGRTEIPVVSIRTGDVIGEHQIIFGGAGERLELIHKAESRSTFAAGVLAAIRWIIKQPAGFYSMTDIINF